MANRFTGLQPGSIAAQIVEELASGAATLRDLCSALPHIAPAHVKSKVNDLRGRRHTRRLRVHSWVTEPRGGRTYTVALYVLGTGRDAPKPPARGGAANQRAYTARKSSRVASIFA